jgi:ribonuclease D
VERYELLDQPQRFAEVFSGLDSATSWSLDTEFVRERTYFPRLCLIQLEISGRILLVDPIRIEDLAPLSALLRGTDIRKIVHSARQDIEVLMPLTGQPLGPVFDTQTAAGLLGFPAQVGYGDLVRQLLGVELEKGHARTDWAARPLKIAQLVYAADDVRYLGAVAEELERRLSAAGRLVWLEEECGLLSDPALYQTRPEDAWQRFKGIERMRPEERAVVQVLAAWREERAIRKDLPRGWVLSDEAIRELARFRPASEAALRQVAALPASLVNRRAEEVLRLVAGALADDGAGPPVERLTPDQAAAAKRLQEVQRAVATELGIRPEILATRRDLSALVRGSRDVTALSGWRRDVIGTRLLEAL